MQYGFEVSAVLNQKKFHFRTTLGRMSSRIRLNNWMNGNGTPCSLLTILKQHKAEITIASIGTTRVRTTVVASIERSVARPRLYGTKLSRTTSKSLHGTRSGRIV